MKQHSISIISRLLQTSLLCTILHISSSQAEVRTGFWQYSEPTSDSTATHIDFSELDRNCLMGSSASGCTPKTTDCFFRLGKLIAPYGVCYDSAVSASLKSLIPAQQLPIETTSLFYLDSMMKRIELNAPVGKNYTDSIPADFGACFIRTSENHHALLLWVSEYIGGLNHVRYYWAYQSDGSSNLAPEQLFTLLERLTIHVDIFSGRPNPYFTITDPATCASLTRLMYIAVNPYLESSAPLSSAPDDCSNHLGYRSMTIYGMFQPYPLYSAFMPEIEICGSGIGSRPTSSNTNWYSDPQKQLAKSVIAAGCALQLKSTNDSGNVPFCDLFPDSLKSFSGSLMKKTDVRKPDNAITVAHSSITCRISLEGVQTLDLYSPDGRHAGQLYRANHSGNATFTVPFNHTRYAPGIYFLALRNEQHTAVRDCIPVTITR